MHFSNFQVVKKEKEITMKFLLFRIVTVDNFNGSDDVQDNAVMGLAYSTFQRILGGNAPQILNPIDRLYSICNNNYYFRCNSRQPNESDENDGM